MKNQELQEYIKQQKEQTYKQFIDLLLNCADGEEIPLLQANHGLIDNGLIAMMQQVANELEEQGNSNSNKIKSIAHNLTYKLNRTFDKKAYLDFISEVLVYIDSGANKKQVHSLLKRNINMLTLELAITLEIWSKETLPQLPIETKKEIGILLNELCNIIRQFHFGNNKLNNIEITIAIYNVISIIYDKENYPFDWSGIQNNLGLAYWERIAEDRKSNIEKAIKYYKIALDIRTKTSFPKEWAMVQNNLGNAYRSRISGDQKNNLELALEFYNAALEVYTENYLPQEWAMVQNNLGNAYRDRIGGDRQENLELAIEACTLALKIRNEEKTPEKWAMTQNNLGNAYRDRIGGDRQENLELAIKSYNAALRVRNETHMPLDWAETQNNLGLAHLKSIFINKEENLEAAIKFFKNSLKGCTEEIFPQQWAITQNNLGVAYRDRIAGDRKRNLELSIKYYEASLTVWTPKSNPSPCLNTASNLGNIYFQEDNYQRAINAYTTAIEAVEQSRGWAISDENKQEIISNAIEVYQNIVQACINLGQIDKAIEYVERGKARNLVDLLFTRDLYPKGNIPQEIKDRLDALRQEAIVEERRLNQQRSRNSFGSFAIGDDRGFGSTFSNDAANNRDRLNQIRQELDNLVREEIQEADSSFQLTQKVEPISFEEIQQTLPNRQTALVEWFISKDTLSVFIVTAQQATPIYIAYTEEQFQALVDNVNRYYGSYLQRDEQWQNNLPSLLAQIAQNLQLTTIIEQIKQNIPDCDRLILVPHRWLHLLPIHALPLSDGKYLLDLFPNGVSYAPSVQLLQLTQEQSKPSLTNLFSVQNPTEDEDLKFTNIEVTAIRSKFTPNDDVVVGKEATKEALTKERLSIANLAHFSCHGTFNFENPELSALQLANSKVDSDNKEQTSDRGDKTRYLPDRDGGSIDLEQCLTLGEIFGLDLRNCRLVTLSACETGITDFRSLSDEYIGLPSGFLFAGSPSVVSSLWTVSDRSTGFLMIKFYQNLENMDSVAVALNQAQLWLRDVTREGLEEWQETLELPRNKMYLVKKFIRSIPPNTRPFASPYHWGAFCAVGS